MINTIKIWKITKRIKVLERKLIEIRRTLYHIYDRIEILLNNMGEITKKRFSSQFKYMGLFEKDDDRGYFEGVLEGIGISRLSIIAYLHGYLRTFKFEQVENNLVNILNAYDRKLKLLMYEPVEYKCIKCDNKILRGYDGRKYNCPLCSSAMYMIPSYEKWYSRDFEGKLSNKAKYSLLHINQVKYKP